MIVGNRRTPIIFILLTFERIANIPHAVEVINTNRPNQLEDIITIEIKINNMQIEILL